MAFEKGHTKLGGRQVGIGNRITSDARELAAKYGKTPLEIILESMNRLYDDGNIIEATDVAAKAAPYVHSKMPTAVNVNSGEGYEMSQLMGDIIRQIQDGSTTRK
jgi:hypothetical protein